jgi:Papain family cysteine protease/Domain of unknown function (DUF4384)
MNRFWLLFLTIAVLPLRAQNATGLTFDDDGYDALPMKAPLTRGLYESMPSSASLKKYCPAPGDQNPHGTCVGWSTSYAARTILWAKQNRQTDKVTITANAFSPDFVYRSVVPYDQDNGCDAGTQIPLALDFMKRNGDVFKRDFASPCPTSVPSYLLPTAVNNKIENFATLFNINDDVQTKVNATKKSLSEGNPVVIGMRVPPSFDRVSGELWSPTEDLNQSRGGHAICVIGYDDAKFGGAFEILNSWGSNWGNAGYFWVKYDVYAYWTKYGFELINNIQPTPPPVVVVPTPPAPKPKPSPSPQPVVVVPTPPAPKPASSTDYDFSGDLRFVLESGTPMNTFIEEIRGLFVPDEPTPTPNPTPNPPAPPKPKPKPTVNPATFQPDPNLTTGKFIAYRMDKAYSEGTKFRLYLRNQEPAYVYAIAMDNTNQAVVLFPNKPNISPALNYKNNEVALPSETNYIQMDNVRGTDVFCLLYSKEPLDIHSIGRRLEQETGTFFQRLYKTMQNQLVDRQYLRYYNQRIRFEVKSNGSGTVVPIVVEIPHN